MRLPGERRAALYADIYKASGAAEKALGRRFRKVFPDVTKLTKEDYPITRTRKTEETP